MKRIVTVIVSIVVLFMASCTPEPLEIEIDQLEPKLVLNSQVVPNQLIVVNLSRTFSALDSPDEDTTSSDSFIDSLLVSGATITISYNNQTDTLIELESGFYLGVTAPHDPNIEYTLNCTDHEGNLSCSASARMLPFVGFENIEANYIAGDSSKGELIFDLTVVDPEEENYYMLNVFKNASDQVEGDINDFFSNGSNLLLRSEIFTDRVFDNDTVNASLSVFNVAPDDSVAITLSNISKDYYDYLSLRQKSSNLFSEVTQEPINYPTNVQGGYGFFNTHFPDVRFFLVSQLP